MTSLDIAFLVVDTFDGRAPQFVCEMHARGSDEDAPAAILTVTDLN